jgi:hypothetical protein
MKDLEHVSSQDIQCLQNRHYMARRWQLEVFFLGINYVWNAPFRAAQGTKARPHVRESNENQDQTSK